ncbi:hypothetical protein CUMW_237290, partial [Citrus unshiu]
WRSYKLLCSAIWPLFPLLFFLHCLWSPESRNFAVGLVKSPPTCDSVYGAQSR